MSKTKIRCEICNTEGERSSQTILINGRYEDEDYLWCDKCKKIIPTSKENTPNINKYKCEDCDCLDGELTICPYAKAINDKIIEVVLCCDCYRNRKEDI